MHNNDRDDSDERNRAPKAYAAWMVAPSDLNEDASFAGFPPSFPTMKDRTVRQVARLSADGEGVRIKFSNLYGTTPITFDRVRIAKSTGVPGIDVATDTPVTFRGASTITIPPQQEAVSDDIAFQVHAGQDVAVSIYVKDTTTSNTAYRFSTRTNYVQTGDATASRTMGSAPENKIQETYWMKEIAVLRQEPIKVIVAFGDSLIDGRHGSATIDSNKSFADQLSARAVSMPEIRFSVINAGLSGNRWLYDRFGPRGTERFSRDVLGAAGVTHAILLLGINDIGFSVDFLAPSEPATFEQLILAISNAADAAKKAGIQVHLGTIPPFKGAVYYTAHGEAMRQAVNDWIRANKAGADGIIDFDSALRNPGDPGTLLPQYDSGDHIHPSDAGYERMAGIVNLANF